MNTILMATSTNFWHNDRGDRSRINNVYKFLIHTGIHVPVYYTGTFTEEDQICLDNSFPEMDLHTPDIPKTEPETEPEQHNLSPYRQSRVWLKNNLPSFIVRPFQIIQSIARRSIKSILRFFIKSMSTSHEPTLNQLVDPNAAQNFAEICSQIQPDAVLIQYIHQAYLLDHIKNHASGGPYRILDTLDVMHLRSQQFRNHNERHWGNISYKEEEVILNNFDLILAIQKNDAAVLTEMAPHIPVLTVGHSLPTVSMNRITKSPLQITYFGTGAAPNRQALSSFLKFVWKPLLRNIHSNAQLHIAGSICDSLSTKRLPKNVVVQGYVDDVAQLYKQSDIVINPVTFGGGLKIKTVEALCHCAPLITTPKGVEGLELTKPPPCLVCNNWPEMVDALHLLLEHPEKRDELSRSAQQYAQVYFSEETAYGPLRDHILALSAHS